MNTIQKIRLKLSLTQKEFGQKIQVSQSSVCQYENGEREPRKKIAYKIIHLANKHGMDYSLNDIY